MIVLYVLSFLFGAVVAAAVLGSALKTVVLPQQDFPRLSQAVFALVHRLLIHRRRSESRSSAFRGIYAAVALVSLPLVWMFTIALAFWFVFWGTGSLTWQRAFEISASSLTTLGFAEPSGTFRIVIAFIEATIGLGLVALLISYLPTIYSAYNGREKGIFLLSPLAGVPPKVEDLVETLHRTGSLDSEDFWRRQSDWIVDVEQTHTAFPILTYFPEAHANLSWVATLGAVLDAAALIVSSSEADVGQVLTDEEKGPLQVLVYGIPTICGIARAVGVPVGPATGLIELIRRSQDPAPLISVSRQEYLDVARAVAPLLGIERERGDDGWRRFASLRSGYDRPLRALAGITQASPAPWTTDRPAVVGRPRILRRRTLPVDWSLGPPGAPASTVGGAATGG
jgi:hypothetical protein